MKKNWKNITEEERRDIFNFSEDFLEFLNRAKTERESVAYIEEKLIKNNFKNINDMEKLKPGDKVYYINRKKSIYAAVIGNKLEDGLKIIGSHIDSPRLDLKPNPIYEDMEQVLFKTHYYGGIKKYQWTCIPLSMRGVIAKTNGEVININLGEDDDFTFTITDLLPHLAQRQNELKLREAIAGEDLNILIGNMQIENLDAKENILNILKEIYHITEEDFLSAEIEFVPAFKAKSLGFDRSMVAGYGQDDRVCSYTNLISLLEAEKPEITCVSIFADKEEIGSMGNTGMMSLCFDSFITELLIKTGKNPYLLNKIFSKSSMLSADVSPAVDVMHKEVSDIGNAAMINHGVVLNKYTGITGKAGASDANAEYVAYIRNILEKKDIPYQIAELGKVDVGGGGTIAYILANKGIDVIDCGIPLLSMHSPYEVSGKFDIYMLYKAYLAFYNHIS